MPNEPIVDIASAIAKVHGQIQEKANGRQVRLIAVSKRQPIERLEAAIATGHKDYGENYPDEMLDRCQRFSGQGIQWHFIGRINRRLLVPIVEHASWIHGVYESRHIEKLGRMLAEGAQLPHLLLQINVDGEATKGGVEPNVAIDTLRQALGIGIRFKGLMMIGPPRAHDDFVRQDFVTLRKLRDRLQDQIDYALPELSMGMSSDFRIAIEEGATMVRVGSLIFGARQS